MFASNTEDRVTGWQNVSQTEQNADGPQFTRERFALKFERNESASMLLAQRGMLPGCFKK
jgi:hypothetical protein